MSRMHIATRKNVVIFVEKQIRVMIVIWNSVYFSVNERIWEYYLTAMAAWRQITRTEWNIKKSDSDGWKIQQISVILPEQGKYSDEEWKEDVFSKKVILVQNWNHLVKGSI